MIDRGNCATLASGLSKSGGQWAQRCTLSNFSKARLVRHGRVYSTASAGALASRFKLVANSELTSKDDKRNSRKRSPDLVTRTAALLFGGSMRAKMRKASTVLRLSALRQPSLHRSQAAWLAFGCVSGHSDRTSAKFESQSFRSSRRIRLFLPSFVAWSAPECAEQSGLRQTYGDRRPA
jgi:hypothetical protein